VCYGVTCQLSCAGTGNEKPDLVNDQCLRIATKCGKHASAEVEEEDERGSRDPYRSEHFKGVYPEHLVCEVYVPKAELTVGPRCEVSDLGLVFELPGRQPDIVDGVGRRGGGGAVWVVGGEHPVPEEEEEFVGRLGGDVSGGGTVLEEDHSTDRGGGEGTRPWGG